jgi:hypothetical protein
MSSVKEFFIDLGFNFGKTLSKPDDNFLNSELALKAKLKDKIFFFKSPNQTNTSFYLVTEPLPKNDFETVRKHIWNENKSDLFFYVSNLVGDILIDLYYSKASPTIHLNECKLDSFNPSEKDDEKIKKINSWQFESGAFWINYHTFLKKSIQRSIDKELVSVLTLLKAKLYSAIAKIEKKENKREEVVQALIDRTLYIKYLEDNHIINSAFYTHYFQSAKVDYKVLLEKNKRKELNRLFKIIHNIFNNSLFDNPSIEEEFLTDEVCSLIYHSLSGTNLVTNQLRLLDFQFDVIPVEFISYIYEVFLSEKQKDNGIFYTPKKLAQLIIDDVIIDDKIAKVLDPSCGSGMFLIVAFQKLLENSKERNFKDIEKRIEHRTKLLSDNIFGIEKEITAQRFTLFSLSLQLFRGLDPSKIKEYIAYQLKENGKVDLFKKFDLSKNIICENSLNQIETPFRDITFEYIVGNPPFFEIKQNSEFKNEISFLNNYTLEVNDKTLKAKDVVGKHQISQCFFLKIKDWSNQNTRFGFVSNSSNFYNDNSKAFQKFFYSEYNIEKIYELSKVKKILFEKAKESVVSLIFSNQITSKNIIEYYPVDMGIFSEKPFELLIIQEDKIIHLDQKKLKENKIRLRDFLVGNEFDYQLVNDLNNNDILNKLFLNDSRFSSFEGLKRISNDDLKKHFNVKGAVENLEIEDLHNRYAKENYLSVTKNNLYNSPFIFRPEGKLVKFTLLGNDGYINLKSITNNNFQRPRNEFIYKGSKIILNRFGKSIQACYIDYDSVFSNLIYGIKLNNEKHYHFVVAILNSTLIDYYIKNKFKKRLKENYTNIDTEILKNIPIPNELDENLVKQISKISKNLTEGNYKYDIETEHKLNELIFDLYDLSYIEKQRIRDYFITKKNITKSQGELEKYKTTLLDTISLFFKDKIDIEFSNQNYSPVVAKIYFNKKKQNTSSAEKTAYYLLNEIFEQNPKENFLASQEKIFGQDCVYIIKDNQNISWTETKAYEDGQEILKHIR